MKQNIKWREKFTMWLDKWLIWYIVIISPYFFIIQWFYRIFYIDVIVYGSFCLLGLCAGVESIYFQLRKFFNTKR